MLQMWIFNADVNAFTHNVNVNHAAPTRDTATTFAIQEYLWFFYADGDIQFSRMCSMSDSSHGMYDYTHYTMPAYTHYTFFGF